MQWVALDGLHPPATDLGDEPATGPAIGTSRTDLARSRWGCALWVHAALASTAPSATRVQSLIGLPPPWRRQQGRALRGRNRARRTAWGEPARCARATDPGHRPLSRSGSARSVRPGARDRA